MGEPRERSHMHRFSIGSRSKHSGHLSSTCYIARGRPSTGTGWLATRSRFPRRSKLSHLLPLTSEHRSKEGATGRTVGPRLCSCEHRKPTHSAQRNCSTRGARRAARVQAGVCPIHPAAIHLAEPFGRSSWDAAHRCKKGSIACPKAASRRVGGPA